MCSTIHPPASGRRKAFTLVEIMVTCTIMGLVAVGILASFLQALKVYQFGTFRVQINKDLRDLTSELTDNGTYANYFMVFQDFTHVTTTTSGVTNLANLSDGTAGDYLILVFKDRADDTKISRIIGYYRAADASGSSALYKFDTTINPSVKVCSSSTGAVGSVVTLWSQLPAAGTINTNTMIIPDSRKQGLGVGSTATILDITDPNNAGTTLGMFYNYYNRSIIVNAKVQYSGNNNTTRIAVSTYNFTISPRG